jgi:hypothetical protein
MPVTVITEYYESPNESRHEEIMYSIQANCNNPSVERVVLFTDGFLYCDIFDFENGHKIEMNNIERRLTYAKVFEYCNLFCRDKVCVVCNNDISFDDTLGLLEDIEYGDFICLTRWDIQEDGTLKFKEPSKSRKYSQDAWAFRPSLPVKMLQKSDFHFGRPGCDNMIAYLAVVSGMKVMNPSEIIKAQHFHWSSHRNYELNSRGTPAEKEKIGKHCLYMNVCTADSMVYNPDKLIYKLQQAWRPPESIWYGEDAIKKAQSMETELEKLWFDSLKIFK